MAYIAAAILGAGALGAGASIWGANKAASAQTSAAQSGIAAQQGMFNQGLGTLQSLLKSGTEQAGNWYGTAKDTLSPFISGGKGAMDTLTSLLTPGANQTAALSQIPGFQFAQDWGQKGVSAQATTRGLGGNALAAGGQYATGLAQQGFGGIVSALQNLLGTGAGAAGTLASGATGTGQSLLSAYSGAGNNILSGANTAGGHIADLTAGIGNAQAGGAIGTANAIGGLGGTAVNATLLSKLLGSGAGSLGPGGVGLNPGGADGIYSAATGGRY